MFWTFLSGNNLSGLLWEVTQQNNRNSCSLQITAPLRQPNMATGNDLFIYLFILIICNIYSICEITKFVNPREKLWELVPRAYGIWKKGGNE